jgi:hypothetical protein
MLEEGEGVVADNRLLAFVGGECEAMVRSFVVGFDVFQEHRGLMARFFGRIWAVDKLESFVYSRE